MDALYSSLPYYLRLIRVAQADFSSAALRDTAFLPEEQRKLEASGKIAQQTNDLAESVKEVMFRAELAIRSYHRLYRAADELTSKIPGINRGVKIRLDRVFSVYTKHTNKIHSLLEPVYKELIKSSSAWYKEYNRIIYDLNKLNRSGNMVIQELTRRSNPEEAPEVVKAKKKKLNDELRALSVSDAPLVQAVNALPHLLYQAREEFDLLEKESKKYSEENSPLAVELEKRKREIQANEKEDKNLRVTLNNLKGKRRTTRTERKTKELSTVQKRQSLLLEFNKYYVEILEKALHDKELSLGIETQTSKAKKEIASITYDIHKLSVAIRKKVEQDKKITLKPGDLTSTQKGKVKSFSRPRTSALRKRLRKAAKRLLVFDYLRHKSL